MIGNKDKKRNEFKALWDLARGGLSMEHYLTSLSVKNETRRSHWKGSPTHRPGRLLSRRILSVAQAKTRAVRGSDYSPTIALSEEKDKLVQTENWRNRIKRKINEMKKYEQPDFSIHNTLYLFFMFVTLYCFNFLSLAVLEKNVMKTFGIHDSSTHCPRGYNVSTF